MKRARVCLSIFVIFCCILMNVMIGVNIVNADGYEENPNVLPINNVISNTAAGLKYGNQVDSSYSINGNGNITLPTDTNGPSGQAMMIQLKYGQGIGDGGIEFNSPVYSNTNYTLEVRLRNSTTAENSNVGPARYGLKGSALVGGERWDRVQESSYVTKTMSFTSTNNKADYQNLREEGNIVFYIYRNFNQDANKDLSARLIYARLIPNTPSIQTSEKTIEVSLSQVKNKKRAEIAEMYASQINTLLEGASVDTNNNNNPVTTELSNIPDSDTVIKTANDNFYGDTLASKWGEQGNNQLYFKIIDDRKIQDPTINKVKDRDNTITGTGTPGDQIEVKDSEGNIIGTTTVDDAGNWSIPVPSDYTLKAGDTLTVNATDPDDGTTRNPASTIVQEVVDPTIHSVKETDTTIKGTGTPGDQIEVKNDEGNVIGTTTVDDEGNWNIPVPSDYTLKPGDTLTVNATDSDNGAARQPASTQVQEVVDPTIHSVKETDTTIKGTGTPGDQIEVKDSEGNVIGTTTVDNEGNWSIPVPSDYTLKAGDTLTANATDPDNGKTRQPATTNVQEVVDPTINSVKSTDTVIKGTGMPGDQIEVKDSKGNVIGTTTVNNEGNWNILVPSNYTLKGGDILTATATDPDNGAVRQPASTNVKGIVNPTVRPVKVSDKDIKGKGTPGDQIKVRDSEGKEIGSTVVDEAGNWKLPVPEDYTLKSDHILTAVATDPDDGTARDLATTKVQGVVNPTINLVKVTDSKITGSGTPGDQIEVKDSEGNIIGTTTVDDEGNWSIPVPSNYTLKEGDILTATATDPDTGQVRNPAMTQITSLTTSTVSTSNQPTRGISKTETRLLQAGELHSSFLMFL